jgi:hypothetical protein
MSLRPTPAAATWFLDLFCSGPEHDSVVGDLFEEYHRGRGRSWYWRQVLVVVFFGLYRGTARRPLARKNRLSDRPGSALPLLLGVLFVAFLLVKFRLDEVVGLSILAIVGGFFCRGIVAYWNMRHSRAVQVLDLHNQKASSIGHSAPLLGTKPLGLIDIS